MNKMLMNFHGWHFKTLESWNIMSKFNPVEYLRKRLGVWFWDPKSESAAAVNDRQSWTTILQGQPPRDNQCIPLDFPD